MASSVTSDKMIGMLRRPRQRLLATTLSFLVASAIVNAQSPISATAEALRGERKFEQAAELLKKHLETYPDDGDAARLLAQTLYWLHDERGAVLEYERAIVRHPADTQLRLDYARMLTETGDADRARMLLTPLLGESGAVGADALTMLGTLEYWEGDLRSAEARFREALAARPNHRDALQQLREIRAATAPWLRISPGVWHDDQPQTRQDTLVEGGWYVTPLTAVRARLQPSRYSSDALATTIWTAETEVEHFAPKFRLETMVRGGVIRRELGTEGTVDWTSAAAVGVRPRRHVTIRLRSNRSPYLATPASLVTSVMTKALSGELHVNHQGWLAETAFGRQYFPDDNAIRTAYVWVLAPLLRNAPVELQAGYAFAADHADETRFGPPASSSPTVPGQVSQPAGAYSPYYTPAHVVKHSVIGGLTAKPAARAVVRLGWSYAVRATEDAPFLFDSAEGTQVAFFKRDFSSWDARGSIDFQGTDRTGVRVAAQLGRGAFYRWASVDIAVTHKFLPNASAGSASQ